MFAIIRKIDKWHGSFAVLYPEQAKLFLKAKEWFAIIYKHSLQKTKYKNPQKNMVVSLIEDRPYSPVVIGMPDHLLRFQLIPARMSNQAGHRVN
jgi:hypothetical protein